MFVRPNIRMRERNLIRIYTNIRMWLGLAPISFLALIMPPTTLPMPPAPLPKPRNTKHPIFVCLCVAKGCQSLPPAPTNAPSRCFTCAAVLLYLHRSGSNNSATVRQHGGGVVRCACLALSCQRNCSRVLAASPNAMTGSSGTAKPSWEDCRVGCALSAQLDHRVPEKTGSKAVQ